MFTRLETRMRQLRKWKSFWEELLKLFQHVELSMEYSKIFINGKERTIILQNMISANTEQSLHIMIAPTEVDVYSNGHRHIS